MEFHRFNHEPERPPITNPSTDLFKLLDTQACGDFLRFAAEAVQKLIMEAGVDGPIGASKHECCAECAILECINGFCIPCRRHSVFG